MTVPYTYLLVFTNPNTTEKKFYYGVRYMKGCHPDDLWITYFTSSKQIKLLRDTFGDDCFQYEIRKVFTTVDSARYWETKVLKRMRVLENEKWLNNTTNEAIAPELAATAAKGKVWIYKDTSEKYVSKQTLNMYLEEGWMLGRYISPTRKEALQIRAQMGLNRKPHGKDGKTNIANSVKGMRRIYHPITKARSKARGEILDSMLQDGWKLGPCHPDDKEKLFPSGKSSPAFGVIFTEERRNKIRQAKLRN
jgi:hypothetical protein